MTPADLPPHHATRPGGPWAKCEIFLGLFAAGLGLMLGQLALARPDLDLLWYLPPAGLALFVLGGYLALAGHRSHLYRSLNEQTAYLARQITNQPGRAPPP